LGQRGAWEDLGGENLRITRKTKQGDTWGELPKGSSQKKGRGEILSDRSW